LGDDPSEEETVKLFGDVLSAGQVDLPVRIFVRDMMASGFPVVRYQIRWTPGGVRPHGYVTHGTDRCLWALRRPNLDTKQWDTANRWIEAVDKELKKVIHSGNPHQPREVLTLKEDQSIGWTNDERWNEFMDLVDILPGERGQGSRL